MVRDRDLKGTDWLSVMIDGVFIGGENCVVIALGIEASGRKQVLDFEVGSSESRESVERLIGSLERRGVHSSGKKPPGGARRFRGHQRSREPRLAQRPPAGLPDPP